MDGILLYALCAAFVAALLTNLMVPPVTRLAVMLRALDHPGEPQAPDERRAAPGRRGHRGGARPGRRRRGGLDAGADWAPPSSRNEMLALAFGTGLVFLVGRRRRPGRASRPSRSSSCRSWPRGRWSRSAGRFEVLRLPVVGEVDLGLFGGVVSLLWIVGVTNAINLIDGLDGLAGGVVTIIAVSLLGYAILQGNPGTVILMAAMAGACVGLPAPQLGAGPHLHGRFRLADPRVPARRRRPSTPRSRRRRPWRSWCRILALGVPVIDTLLVMTVRFLDRPHSAPRRPLPAHVPRRPPAPPPPARPLRRPALAHRGGDLRASCSPSAPWPWWSPSPARPPSASPSIVLEFSVILAMRRVGMAMEARRLARLQREEIKTEVLGIPQEPKVATVRRIAR